MQIERLFESLAGGKLYDTIEGFGADEAVMRGKIARAEHDGRVRSRATRKGQKEYRENGGTFGGPRLDKACKASALARSKTARIRHDEFRTEHAKARQAGAGTSGAVAEFFNHNGYLPARARRWTAANVRAALNEIRIEDEAEIAAQLKQRPSRHRRSSMSSGLQRRNWKPCGSIFT
jgi:hypothetical protein